MPFLPGKPKTGGRQPGVPNRLTTAFREAVQVVYNDIGGHEAFLQMGTRKSNRVLPHCGQADTH